MVRVFVPITKCITKCNSDHVTLKLHSLNIRTNDKDNGNVENNCLMFNVTNAVSHYHSLVGMKTSAKNEPLWQNVNRWGVQRRHQFSTLVY